MNQLTMAGHLIRRLHQISVSTFQQSMKSTGEDLTPVQFATMQALLDNPGVEQAKVAEIIDFDRATIGGVLERLEQKGFLNRSVSQQDRRAREVRLTNKGVEVVSRLYPQVRKLQKEILRGLNAGERKMFIELAQKIISSG